EADVVVIAEVTAVADSGEKTKLGGWDTVFIGMNATFAPKYAIKGAVKGEMFQVLHYRVGGGVLIENGPTLVSFRIKPLSITGKHGKMGVGRRPQYLLFLRKKKDGRYEAVSGQ